MSRQGLKWTAAVLGTVLACGFGLMGCGGGGSDGPGKGEVNSDGSLVKVLRIPMQTDGPGSLDPVVGSTVYENRAVGLINETLLQYKYLVRPFELEPLLLDSMPEVLDGGRVFRCTLRDDLYFTDNPCFPDGKGRKLTSDDVIYSFKRHADPKYRYENWWIVDGVIEGFDAYRQQQEARVDAGEAFDYDAEVDGLRKIDDRTFEFRLTKPDQQFIWKLAMFQFAPVAREAVEHYGDQFAENPVGTGPFVLRSPSDWVRGQKMTFYRNPNYREAYYPEEHLPEDEEFGFHLAAGKRVPFVDVVEYYFFTETQPMWLEFKAGNLDMTTTDPNAYEEAFDRTTNELKRAWQRRNVTAHQVPLLDFIFRGFNMEDPLVGGYSPDKQALRQAIHLCIDYDEMNEAYYSGLAVVYDGPIPPGLDGYPPNGRAEKGYRGPDYDLARQKLREAGYTIGADGKVTDLPPIDLYTSRGSLSQMMTELMQRHLAEVGIQLNPRYVDFSVLIQNVNNKKAPMFSYAWSSDYPDAENNFALFYGPNEAPGSNSFNYKRPEFDRMYERIKTMPPGPERTAIYEEMRDMILQDQPYSGSMARTRTYLVHPWVKNYKPTEKFWDWVKYVDVDPELQSGK